MIGNLLEYNMRAKLFVIDEVLSRLLQK